MLWWCFAQHEQGKRREIEIIPAQAHVIKHVRHVYVYACRECQKNDTTTPMLTAPMPARYSAPTRLLMLNIPRRPVFGY
jgi:hypothetical protein